VIGTPLKEEIPLSYGTTTFRSFTRADQPVAKITPIEDDMIIEFQFHMYFVMKDIKAAEWACANNRLLASKHLAKLLVRYFEATVVDAIPSGF
jgi:hypothetical protein